MGTLTVKQREWLQALIEAEAGTVNDYFGKANKRSTGYKGGGWCLLNGSGKVAALTVLEQRGLVETYGGDFWRSTEQGRAAVVGD